MTLGFDLPTLPDSFFRRLDARWKFVALAGASAIVAFFMHFLPALLAFLGGCYLLWLAQLPGDWFRGRLLLLLPLLAGLFLFLPLVLHGEGGHFYLGPLRISLYGFLVALRVSCKALAILTLMLILVATTPMPELLKAAHWLRIPGFFVQLTALSYRHLLLLLAEMQRLRVALRVRGFRNRPKLQSYRVISQVTGTLLVRSSERAERVSHAME